MSRYKPNEPAHYEGFRKVPCENPPLPFPELRARVRATGLALQAAQRAYDHALAALRDAEERAERSRRPDPTRPDTTYLHERRLAALNRSYGDGE